MLKQRRKFTDRNGAVDRVASQRHHQFYDNGRYSLACMPLDIEMRNHLIDEAMALCGSPYYKRMPEGMWHMDAILFLEQFPGAWKTVWRSKVGKVVVSRYRKVFRTVGDKNTFPVKNYMRWFDTCLELVGDGFIPA